MNSGYTVLALAIIALIMILGCSNSSTGSQCGSGGKGASCISSADCVCNLQCVDERCIEYTALDGDAEELAEDDNRDNSIEQERLDNEHEAELETVEEIDYNENQPACAIPNAGSDQVFSSDAQLNASLSQESNHQIISYKWTIVEHPDSYDGTKCAIYSIKEEKCVTGIWTTDPYPSIYYFQGIFQIRLSLMDAIENCTDTLEDVITVHFVQLPLPFQITLSSLDNVANSNYNLYLLREGGQHKKSCASNNDECCIDNCRFYFYDSVTNPNLPRGWETDHNCPIRGCPGPSNSPNWGDEGIRWDDPRMIEAIRPDSTWQVIQFDIITDRIVGHYSVIVEPKSNVVGTPKVHYQAMNQPAQYFTPSNAILPRTHWNVCDVFINQNGTIEVLPIDTIEPTIDD